MLNTSAIKEQGEDSRFRVIILYQFPFWEWSQGIASARTLPSTSDSMRIPKTQAF